MKRFTAIIAVLIISGCSMLTGSDYQVAGESPNHQVITGTITTDIFRWEFSAEYGTFEVRENDSAQWREPATPLLWDFRDCRLVVVDPLGTITGFQYRVTVWR